MSFAFVNSRSEIVPGQGASNLELSPDPLPPVESVLAEPPVVEVAPEPWIVSKWFDLFFVCGLAPWVVGVLAFLIFGSVNLQAPIQSPFETVKVASLPASPLLPVQNSFSIMFVISSLLIGETHQFTSIVRYYCDFRKRKRSYVLHRVPFWVLYFTSALLGVFFLFPSSDLSSRFSTPLMLFGQFLVVFLNFFPVFLMQHICAQARSIGSIYCGKRGFKFSKSESRALSLVTLSLVLAGGATIAQPFNIEALGTVQELLPLRAALVTMGVACTGLFALHLVVQRGLRQKEWLPAPTALMWGNLLLWSLLPCEKMLFVLLTVPLLFHATQHWAVAWSSRRKELLQSGVNLDGKLSQLGAFGRMLLPILALTFVVLFLPAFWRILSGINDGSTVETLGVEFSLIVFYFHYFADRIVWRPR